MVKSSQKNSRTSYMPAPAATSYNALGVSPGGVTELASQCPWFSAHQGAILSRSQLDHYINHYPLDYSAYYPSLMWIPAHTEWSACNDTQINSSNGVTLFGMYALNAPCSLLFPEIGMSCQIVDIHPIGDALGLIDLLWTISTSLSSLFNCIYLT